MKYLDVCFRVLKYDILTLSLGAVRYTSILSKVLCDLERIVYYRFLIR